MVFITYFDKSILCAAVGVVIAAVVRPTRASQWGGGYNVLTVLQKKKIHI